MRPLALLNRTPRSGLLPRDGEALEQRILPSVLRSCGWLRALDIVEGTQSRIGSRVSQFVFNA